MKYLIYISTAVKLMNDDDLCDILNTSRSNNQALNVTGMLIYSEGTFIQVLEGDEIAVNKIYKDIEQDLRHKNIIKLIDEVLAGRNFPNWSMAFVTVNAAALEELEGYINPDNSNFMETDNRHAAVMMLKTFAENNRITG